MSVVVSNRVRLVAVILAVALASVSTTRVEAQQYMSLDVLPAKSEFVVDAGHTQTFAVSVRNDGAETTHVQTSLSDFTIDENGEHRLLAAGTTPFSLAPYLSIRPREFDVAPGQMQQIVISFALPADNVGEFAAIAFFETRATRFSSSLAVNERVASKMYAVARGTERIDGAVDDVKVRVAQDGEHLAVGFANVGNIHEYVSGYVDIRRSGVLVQHVHLADNQLVERNDRVVFQASVKPLPRGLYDLTAVCDYRGATRAAARSAFTIP
jgi:hypothetical protein